MESCLPEMPSVPGFQLCDSESMPYLAMHYICLFQSHSHLFIKLTKHSEIVHNLGHSWVRGDMMYIER